ncbi:Zinc finger protein 277 [Chionoecetes opilio]|uniref:Zinc finger protein 277 n=1 Tax=Chionoecetes opilio TaxID=41210 RepID=A0A8J5CXI1_CHIOP|nr:Zinc finger protein 277 [Chionoecetes opilio]
MGAWGSDFAALDFNFASDAPVGCPLCPQSFAVMPDSQLLLQHLLEAHHLVIGEVEQVADLRQYILYWGKLSHLKLQDYCVVINTSNEPGAPAAVATPANTYYLLCDKLPEDCKLRRSLMQMKLKHVVNQKERECQDMSFSRQCIYCSETVTGGVTNCFHHLTHQHSFSLGNPNNIVYGAQLLDILHEKLRNLQCLCCEKIFRTHKMLREHMRKQQHRCLNPKNKIYDRFYLRNYLRPGMPWEETKRDLDEESDTESMSEGVRQTRKFQEEPTWTDWQEVNTQPTTCLFCPFTTTKMVEWRCLLCRNVFANCEVLQKHINDAAHFTLPHHQFWDLPQYHIPVCDNDGLLQHLEDDGMDEQQGDPGCLTRAAEQARFCGMRSRFKAMKKNCLRGACGMVFPEDVQPLGDSILQDSSLREEIARTEDKDVELVVKCLFCRYTMLGEHAHLQVYAHMRVLHCFDFPEVVRGLSYYTQVKLVNYMRRKTARSECPVCGRVLQGRSAVEEHRVLANHAALPPAHLFQDQSWLKPVLEEDGLLQRLREDGDSDDEDPSVPDSSREEASAALSC